MRPANWHLLTLGLGYGDQGQGPRGDGLPNSLTVGGAASYFTNTYQYDAYDELSKVVQTAGSSFQTANFAYDTDGNLQSIARLNGGSAVATSTYLHDLNDRLYDRVRSAKPTFLTPENLRSSRQWVP